MSLAELKAEIAKLSPEDKQQLREALDVDQTTAAETQTMAEYLGCARGMMKFNPGWDDPEPLEDWNALRDDTPL